MSYLQYDKGLSKYAVVKALFPDDAFTHRMKRLQRAARCGVWAAHFDIVKAHGSNGDGMYPVERLVPKNRQTIIWASDGTGKLHTSAIMHVYKHLRFDHERHPKRMASPWLQVLTNLRNLFKWPF